MVCRASASASVLHGAVVHFRVRLDSIKWRNFCAAMEAVSDWRVGHPGGCREYRGKSQDGDEWTVYLHALPEH